MSEADRARAVEQWREGVPLSGAWLAFGDPYAVGAYRAAGTLDAKLVRQILMVCDLWDALRSGELIAFGKCVAPKISDGPIPLPTHTFEFEPPRGTGDGDEIEVSGWRYEGVKVIRAILSGSDSPEPLPKTPSLTQSRGGRPDTFGKAAEALEAIFAENGDRSLSPEKLYSEFEAEFQRQFPIESYKVPTPALRTFRNHLKRYRQELAEIGNNQSAR